MFVSKCLVDACEIARKLWYGMSYFDAELDASKGNVCKLK